MDIKNKIRLQKNTKLLRRDLDVNEILPHLVEKLLIGEEQVERIYAGEVSAERNERLLKCIKRGDNKTYNEFLKAIEESDSCSHIFGTVMETVVTDEDVKLYKRSQRTLSPSPGKPLCDIDLSNHEESSDENRKEKRKSRAEQADSGSPKRLRKRSRSRSHPKTIERRSQTAGKSQERQRRTGIKGVVVCKHPGNDQHASVVIDTGEHHTKVVAFHQEGMDILNNLLIGGKYKFKYVIIHHHDKYITKPTYKYDDKSSCDKIGINQDVSFTSLKNLPHKDFRELVNVRGFLERIEKKDEANTKVVAWIWLQSDGVQTCVQMYSGLHPIFACEPGKYIEIKAASVGDVVLRDEGNILVVLNQTKTTFIDITTNNSGNLAKHTAPQFLLRQVQKLHSFKEVDHGTKTGKWYTFDGKLDNFKRGERREKSLGIFMYLACPSCRTDMAECEGTCPNCPYDAEESEEKPRPSIVLNVSVRAVQDKETDPCWLVIFSSAKFFDQLPGDLFPDLDEELFLELSEKAQIARIKKIIKKGFTFRFTVRLMPQNRLRRGNPVVEIVERIP